MFEYIPVPNRITSNLAKEKVLKETPGRMRFVTVLERYLLSYFHMRISQNSLTLTRLFRGTSETRAHAPLARPFQRYFLKQRTRLYTRRTVRWRNMEKEDQFITYSTRWEYRWLKPNILTIDLKCFVEALLFMTLKTRILFIVIHRNPADHGTEQQPGICNLYKSV